MTISAHALIAALLPTAIFCSVMAIRAIRRLRDEPPGDDLRDDQVW